MAIPSVSGLQRLSHRILSFDHTSRAGCSPYHPHYGRYLKGLDARVRCLESFGDEFERSWLGKGEGDIFMDILAQRLLKGVSGDASYRLWRSAY